MIYNFNTLRSSWLRFWFRPENPFDLGFCRFVAYAFLISKWYNFEAAGWAALPAALWVPSPIFRALGIGLLPATVLVVMAAAWKVSLVTSMIGLWTRASTLLSFLLGVYLLNLPSNFGKVTSLDAAASLFLLLFTLCRCGDAFSLDRLIAGWRCGRVSLPADSAYAWPMQVARVLCVCVFFGAAIAKLQNGGIAWVTSDNMKYILLEHYYIGVAPPSTLALLVAEHPWIYKSLAAAGLLFELLVPLALISRTARWMIVPALIVFAYSVYFLLGKNLFQLHMLLVFWVPWQAVFSYCRQKLR